MTAPKASGKSGREAALLGLRGRFSRQCPSSWCRALLWGQALGIWVESNKTRPDGDFLELEASLVHYSEREEIRIQAG